MYRSLSAQSIFACSYLLVPSSFVPLWQKGAVNKRGRSGGSIVASMHRTQPSCKLWLLRYPKLDTHCFLTYLHMYNVCVKKERNQQASRFLLTSARCTVDFLLSFSDFFAVTRLDVPWCTVSVCVYVFVFVCLYACVFLCVYACMFNENYQWCGGISLPSWVPSVFLPGVSSPPHLVCASFLSLRQIPYPLAFSLSWLLWWVCRVWGLGSQVWHVERLKVGLQSGFLATRKDEQNKTNKTNKTKHLCLQTNWTHVKYDVSVSKLEKKVGGSIKIGPVTSQSVHFKEVFRPCVRGIYILAHTWKILLKYDISSTATETGQQSMWEEMFGEKKVRGKRSKTGKGTEVREISLPNINGILFSVRCYIRPLTSVGTVLNLIKRVQSQKAIPFISFIFHLL